MFNKWNSRSLRWNRRSLLLSRRPWSSDIVLYTIYNYTDIQCIAYALKPFFGMVAYSKWAELKRIPVKLTVPFRI